MQDKVVLHTLSTGHEVVWHKAVRGIAVDFCAPMRTLSTSLLNGGYREDVTAVFNHNTGPADGTHAPLKAPTYVEHLEITAEEMGLPAATTTGMGTAASMENAAIVVKTYQDLVVSAIATAGVEGNGGRVGDPAEHYLPGVRLGAHKPGTINVLLVIDAALPPGALTRALVTCTEAKTAALQELMVGSLYSTGLATGSGTDQTVLVCNPASPLYFEGAGKHVKLGELIGLAVKEAVKKALYKQNGLSPQSQHSVLQRFKRFGLTEETLWEYYDGKARGKVEKDSFLEKLRQWDTEGKAVAFAAQYAHILDEGDWGLLSEKEVHGAICDLLGTVSFFFGGVVCQPQDGQRESCLEALHHWIAACLERRLAYDNVVRRFQRK